MNRVASFVDAGLPLVRSAVALTGEVVRAGGEGVRGALTERQARRLAALRQGARLLDSAIRVPGTSRRIGIDPIVGLIAGYGDLVSPLFTVAVLWHARDMGVPRMVQVRMLYNAGIDALIGAVPFLGDLFDFAWKSNQRNVALLERYAHNRPPTFGDRLFALALIGALLAMAAVPILLTAALVALVLGTAG